MDCVACMHTSHFTIFIPSLHTSTVIVDVLPMLCFKIFKALIVKSCACKRYVFSYKRLLHDIQYSV